MILECVVIGRLISQRFLSDLGVGDVHGHAVVIQLILVFQTLVPLAGQQVVHGEPDVGFAHGVAVLLNGSGHFAGLDGFDGGVGSVNTDDGDGLVALVAGVVAGLVQRCDNANCHIVIVSENELDFDRLIQKWVDEYNVFAYECPGACALISSMNEYYRFNMELMDGDLRAELFKADRPILTKVRDDAPCKYGLTSSVKNSLVSQGCFIDGEVENCVISKGVHIAKGAKVSNCIIMQDSEIGEGCNLNYLIIDKDVKIAPNKSMAGADSYPIHIEKKSVIK